MRLREHGRRRVQVAARADLHLVAHKRCAVGGDVGNGYRLRFRAGLAARQAMDGHLGLRGRHRHGGHLGNGHVHAAVRLHRIAHRHGLRLVGAEHAQLIAQKHVPVLVDVCDAGSHVGGFHLLVAHVEHAVFQRGDGRRRPAGQAIGAAVAHDQARRLEGLRLVAGNRRADAHQRIGDRARRLTVDRHGDGVYRCGKHRRRLLAIGRCRRIEVKGDLAAVRGHIAGLGVQRDDARLVLGVVVRVLQVMLANLAADRHVGVQRGAAKAHRRCHVEGVAADGERVDAAHGKGFDALRHLRRRARCGFVSVGRQGDRRQCQGKRQGQPDACCRTRRFARHGRIASRVHSSSVRSRLNASTCCKNEPARRLPALPHPCERDAFRPQGTVGISPATGKGRSAKRSSSMCP